MKKFILILCMITLVGCGNVVPPADMNVSEIESETVTEMQSEETVAEIFPAVTDIETGEPDSTYFLNHKNILFSDDSGRYYYSHKNGRDDGYYVLLHEDKDKKCSFVENADDFSAYIYKENVFYGSYRNSKLCSFKDGKYTELKYEEKDISDFYFTDEFIYCLCRNDAGTEFLRMRYDGSDPESVAFINLNVSKYAVHGNNIFYEADYMKYGVYDTETNTDTSLDEGGAGSFCGDYMYYISTEHHLCRMNLNDHSVEKLCENVRLFAFYDGYILYQPYSDGTTADGQIYRLGKGENVKILDADQIFKNSYYYDVSAIQTKDEHIYIEINSGPYFSYIAEIDIDGNIVETIYSHTSD